MNKHDHPLALNVILTLSYIVYGFFVMVFMLFLYYWAYRSMLTTVLMALSVMGFIVFTYVVIRRVMMAYKYNLIISDTVHDGIVISNQDNDIIYVNRVVEETTGYTNKEIIGQKPSFFKSDVHDAQFYQSMWHDILHEGGFHGEIWDQRKDGQLHPKDLTIRPIKLYGQAIKYYVAIYKDLSQFKKVQSEKDFLTHHMKETNLPNETYLLKKITEALHQNTALTLFVIKITNKTYLSESYSVYEYYEAIKSRALAIHSTFKDGFLAQINGEFLAYIGFENQDEHKASQVASRLVERLKTHADDPLHFEVKIGSVVSPKDSQETHDLYNKALVALSEAHKYRLKNYVGYDKRIHDKLIHEYKVRDALDDALKKDRVYVVYQPLIDLSSSAVLGFEVLVRFNDERLNKESIIDIIKISEKYNMINRISEVVLKHMFADKKSLDEALGYAVEMAFNTSIMQYEDDTLLNTLKAHLKAHDYEGKEFVLEITENTLAHDYDNTSAYLEAIKQLGIEIAIDDFGIGLSSLSRIKYLPVTKLKIDRSFIRSYPGDDGGAIIKTMVAMAENLKLDVIVEGVETKEQCQFLETQGNVQVQGYYFAKPMPLAEAITFAKTTTIPKRDDVCEKPKKKT